MRQLPLLPPGRPPGRFVRVWARAVHVVEGEGAPEPPEASGRSGRGPLVLLESGLGGSWLGWDPVLPELRDGFRVLRADRPGLGRSRPAPGVPSLALRAAWSAALLDALGVREPVVVCGHSLGGLYAEAFARLHPERVSGVVLVEAHADNVKGEVLGHRERRVRLARLAGHAFRCAGLSQLVAPGVRRLGMRTQSVRGGDQADVGDAYRSAYGAGHCLTEALVERVLVRDFIAELAELRRTTRFPDVPLRVLSAPAAAPAVYRAQAGMSARGRHVEVEGALHLMPVDRPDAIAAAIRAVADEAANAVAAGALPATANGTARALRLDYDACP